MLSETYRKAQVAKDNDEGVYYVTKGKKNAYTDKSERVEFQIYDKKLRILKEKDHRKSDFH